MLSLERRPLDGPEHLTQLRLRLDDGSATTAHVAVHPRARTTLRVVRLPDLTPLGAWCDAERVDEALVGGFYVREGDRPWTGSPLGELRLGGSAAEFVPFTAPWGTRRACVQTAAGSVRIARREELPEAPPGDLLQAGPMLVRDGVVVDGDDEGFSAGADQFDSDITAGRHPRAALGYDRDRLIAFACDGRDDDEAGLTIAELARAMVHLGATDALNLDGGGSTSLVCGGRLRNVPREAHGVTVAGGRAIATALVFAGTP